SRARKQQAYTMELEAEVQKLKDLNEELVRKQKEILEMQKREAPEMKDQFGRKKRQCLRRTLTGPW
uniref:BZIP domain-containing protein n=1 Tax=Aegilops tauschii subsp. strangulata TaxID=200361 RepID=A0A453KZ84_AEGTS